MTKINQGGVECEIINTAKKDAAITINLSSIGRHSIGPWQIKVFVGAQTYLVTVALEGKP